MSAPQDEPRDQEVKVYGLPYAVTRTELRQLTERAFDGSNADAMTLARTLVTRDAVCEPSNWFRCPRHEPRGFPSEPCPEPPVPGIPFPVVTDPAMPEGEAIVVSRAPAGKVIDAVRVRLAPVGTGPDEPGWTDVGTLTEPVEWSIGSRGDHAPVMPSSFTFEPYTVTLNADLPRHLPSKMLPASAPLDVWDVLTGTDRPGSRGPARKAALAALSAACHDAYRAHRAQGDA